MNRKYWRAYILARIKVDPKTGCWLWQLSRFPPGYGQAGYARKLGLSHYAHRLSFMAFKGPIPKKKVVRHQCHNPPCCNPAHLLVGTQKDNLEDAKRAGRKVGSTARNPLNVGKYWKEPSWT